MPADSGSASYRDGNCPRIYPPYYVDRNDAVLTLSAALILPLRATLKPASAEYHEKRLGWFITV